MKQHLFGVAVLVALIAAGSAAAQACRSSLRALPAPGGELAQEGPVTLIGSAWNPALRNLAERGPVLKSLADEVPLRVAERVTTDDGRVRFVLVPRRPLIAGHAYALAVTRTETGFGLNRAEPIGVGLTWTAGAAGDPPSLRAAHGCRSSLLGRLALFGALPFFLGYAGVATALAARRRA